MAIKSAECGLFI